MKNKVLETFRLSLFVAFCVLLNYAGKILAQRFSLPLWLDAYGTVIAGAALGPFCGALVGMAVNIMAGLNNPLYFVYAITSASIGIIAGLCAKHKWLDSFFGSMTTGVLITLSSVAISTPLNYFFFGGLTGNIWGDSVIAFFRERKLNEALCIAAGEFYVDFLDKALCLLIVFILLTLQKKLKGRNNEEDSQNQKGLPAGLSGKTGLVSKTIIPALAIFFLCAMPARAADFETYIRTVYSNANGLPSGEANGIVQAKSGILWVGTSAGLYRYNGSEFRWMKDWRSTRSVTCLFEDEEGRLLIGTNDSGLSICINEHIANIIGEAEGLPSSSVRSIVRSSGGDFYVGTAGALAILSVNTGLHVETVLNKIESATQVTADEDENIAAVTSDGTLFLIHARKVLKSITLPTESEKFSAAAFSPDGLLYAGTTKNRIFVYKISDGDFAERAVLDTKNLSYINCLKFSDDGLLYVCADNGIGCFENTSRNPHFDFINTGAFNNSIGDMTRDYQGNLWFTSSRQGLLRLSPSSFKNLYASAGLERRVVNAVDYYKGYLYFATDSGLDILDERTLTPVEDETKISEYLKGTRIRSIKGDKKGRLWFACYEKGLVCLEDDGKITQYDSAKGAFGNWMRIVTELSDGTICAAGDTGIVFLKDGKVTGSLGYRRDLENSMVTSLMETPEGLLLAGTDGAGIAVIKEKRIVRWISAKDGLGSSVILRTALSSDEKNIFIITSNCLSVMDKDFRVRTLENFPYSNNYDVFVSGGKVFVTGSAGIHVASEAEILSDSKDLHCTLLNAQNGLDSALTANSWHWADRQGLLYLPCNTGVYVLDTKDYDHHQKSYRMSLASVALDGVQFSVDRHTPFTIGRAVEKIDLYPEVINFTAINPTVRYWLEGFDQKPTVIPQSELTAVTYTNMPSGKYTFHIAVLGENGSVIEQSGYSIVKEAAMHDQRFFIAYLVIVAMLAVAWFTWFIVRTQIQRQLAMQRKELEFARVQMENMNLFSKFTNTTVAEAIQTKTVDFTPHLKDCTVLFADIRDFTAISDGFRKKFGRDSAEKIVTFLNSYLSRMVDCISRGRGSVDKFEGDCIMAVWGLLRKKEDQKDADGQNQEQKAETQMERYKRQFATVRQDALDCIKTALAMRCALIAYNEEAEKDTTGVFPKIRIGTGINTGRVTAGILGGEQKLEYTAIGDAVNLASRTESASKFCGADILITEPTYDLVRESGLVVERIPAAITVKGKGRMLFYAVVNLPSLDLAEFFGDELSEKAHLGAGAAGPKSLSEVRSLLGIPNPEYERLLRDEEKITLSNKFLSKGGRQ